MIDLHMHTFFSDGVLSPSELVYRAKTAGYTAIGLTDHADFSNIEITIKSILKVTGILEKEYNITVLSGIELTYIPPRIIKRAAALARRLGAEVVVVHGESPVEPVPPGTNSAAVSAGIDILAHPGFITHKDAEQAKKNNVSLEITARKGHSTGNHHVAQTAMQCGASLVLNTDTHMPEDILTAKIVNKVLQSAKLSNNDFNVMQNNALKIIKKRHKLKK